MRRLRLMADYECHPLWESQEEGLHHVDPFELAIPEQLAEALTEWAGQYTASLNQSDPTRPGFGTGRRRTGGFGGGRHSRRSFEARGSTSATSTRGNRPELVAANE